MPKIIHQSTSETVEQQNTVSSIQRPLSFKPYVLMGEKLIMIPLRVEHQPKLHADIFSQPHLMHYMGPGKSYTYDEFTPIFLDRLNGNLLSKRDKSTGRLSMFTWTILTSDGIAGWLKISPTKGRTELAYCISPAQQGRALARRASELAVEYLGEETSFVATAHPKNQASAKTLESIRYSDGKFLFFRDPARQNVQGVYGPDQPRDYFLSKERSKFSFFSVYKGHSVHLSQSHELENEDNKLKIPPQ